MKRIIITFFAFALITTLSYVQATGQQPAASRCSLTESNSPGVRGIKLGMSTEQLLALFPGSSKRKEIKDALERAKTSASGEPVYLSFYPAIDASGDRFAGVDSVSVGLYKGRVIDFNLQYVGPTWRNIDEWVGKLSETLNLPGAQEWTVGPYENPNKVLSCSGIQIEALIQGGGGSVRIRNADYLKGAEDRANAGEERKRRDFKP